ETNTNYRVKNVSASMVFSTAPSGSTPSGHFMFRAVENVKLMGCHTKGGYNTSAYGFTKDSRGIVLVGCTEVGLIGSSNYVEGSAQIEECPEANAVIANCSFS